MKLRRPAPLTGRRWWSALAVAVLTLAGTAAAVPPEPASAATVDTSAWTYTNPVVWQDFADGDIIRVGDAYYYSVPSLDFGSNAYNLTGGRAYVKGIWASTLNYRRGNSTYYWIGCVEFNRTYVYTASTVDGTWSKRSQINGDRAGLAMLRQSSAWIGAHPRESCCGCSSSHSPGSVSPGWAQLIRVG